MSVTMRQEVERKIAVALIDSLLAAGFQISVFDSEEVTLNRSTDAKAILAAMFTSDDDRLFVYRPENNEPIEEHLNPPQACDGWVWFIYGNDGWDVISDYTTNLEPYMTEANKISDHYSE